MIYLVVEPGVVLSWDEFTQTKPPYSIALDGYVNSVSELEFNGPYLNLDHHSGVRRLITRSTCSQVYLAIVLGLFKLFQKDNQPHANVYVNDCDQDVCLSYWLLKNPDKIMNLKAQDNIARLIIGEDFLDATAGSFPIDLTRDIMQQSFWIFEPYTIARNNGELKNYTSSQILALIQSVYDRIDLYTEGKAQKIEMDFRHKIVGGGKGWVLAEEIGAYARAQLYQEGIQALITFRDNQDGTYTYSIGKISVFINFPIQELYNVLNHAENLTDSNNQWGGSTIIGGSPRISGSKLKPEELENIVNHYLSLELDGLKR
jgi:hypothetical protein